MHVVIARVLVVHVHVHVLPAWLLGNTKVITQTALQTFQEEMGKVMKDPYKVCVCVCEGGECVCVGGGGGGGGD